MSADKLVIELINKLTSKVKRVPYLRPDEKAMYNEQITQYLGDYAYANKLNSKSRAAILDYLLDVDVEMEEDQLLPHELMQQLQPIFNNFKRKYA